MYLFFFFNDTATTEIYTLSLHDALPICRFSTSSPASLASGVPVAKMPTPSKRLAGSSPATAVIASAWSTAASKARRASGLSNGGEGWVEATVALPGRWRETGGGVGGRAGL